MPDNFSQGSDNTLEKLAQLGEQFNTNKSFGLMGYLENQEQANQPQAPVEEPSPAPTREEAPPTDWIEPINSSLRAMQSANERALAELRGELRQVAQAPAQEAQEVDPATRVLTDVNQKMTQLQLQTAYERARNSLNSLKVKNPDFDYTEKELQDVWQSHIGNNADAANATNWEMYFEQQYAARSKPKLEKRISELQSELSQLKNGSNPVGAMGSVPRSGRSVTPPSAGEGFDEDLYQRASSRMGKGKFMGFNQILMEEQQKRSLRNAS